MAFELFPNPNTLPNTSIPSPIPPSNGEESNLTLKQRKWLEVYIETGNATEAARQAYNCKDDNSAGVMGYETLRKLNIPISDLMDRMGLSEGRLMKTLDDGINAMKTEVAKYQGGIEDEKDYIDLPTRKTYLELALKIRGLLLDKLHLSGQVSDELVIVNAPEEQKEEE